MEKIRTNIFYILIALTMLIGIFQMPTAVKAAEPQFGTSTVTYTVDDYFYVQIPETINVGTESMIYAYETNIAPGKSIYVRIEGLDGLDSVKLQNDNDPSKEINVYFTNESGSRYSAQNNLVAQFGSNVNGEVQTAIINTETDANQMQAVAGSYSGQVYFSMICE